MSNDNDRVLLPNTPELDQAKRDVIAACDRLASIVMPSLGKTRTEGVKANLADGGTVCVEVSMDSVQHRRVTMTMVRPDGARRIELVSITPTGPL